MVQRVIFAAVLALILGCGRNDSLTQLEALSKPDPEWPVPVPADSRMSIAKAKNNDVELVWTGEVDDSAILKSLGEVYEQVREKANAQPTKGRKWKLYFRLYLHPKDLIHGGTYITASNAEAEQVPAWDDKLATFSVGHLSQKTRLSAEDEDLYFKYRDAYRKKQQAQGMSQIDMIKDVKGRKEYMKEFCEEQQLDLQKFERLVAHRTLWRTGFDVTEQAIDEYIEESHSTAK